MMALCISRLPRVYREPDYLRKFREWRDVFETKTQDRVTISDGLAYLKTPGHFLPNIEERERRGTAVEFGKKESRVHVSEIDLLLASEGIPGLGVDESDHKVNQTQQHAAPSGEDHTANTPRWLIVKYTADPCVWTFPFTHRQNADNAEITLGRLCQEQLGLNIHIPSMAPAAFRKISGNTDITSRMFYYRGMFIPKSREIDLTKNPNIVDAKWVDRAELENSLPVATWQKIRYALPLE